MWAGSIVVSYVRSRPATWVALLVLLATHLYLNYCAVCAVRMTSLNRQRAAIVFGTYLAHQGRVLTPRDAQVRERIFERDGVVRDANTGGILGYAQIGVSFEDYLRQVGTRRNLSTSFAVPQDGLHEVLADTRSGREKHFLIHLDERNRQVFIALDKRCTVQDQLQAWFIACVALQALHNQKHGTSTNDKSPGHDVSFADGQRNKGSESGRSVVMEEAQRNAVKAFPDLLKGLIEAGWNVETGALETQRATRYAVVEDYP